MFDYFNFIDGCVLLGLMDVLIVVEFVVGLDELLFLKVYNVLFEFVCMDFDWLSCDEVEVDVYVVDLLCGFDVFLEFMVFMMGGVVLFGDFIRVGGIWSDLLFFVMVGDVDLLNGEFVFLYLLVDWY